MAKTEIRLDAYGQLMRHQPTKSRARTQKLEARGRMIQTAKGRRNGKKRAPLKSEIVEIFKYEDKPKNGKVKTLAIDYRCRQRETVPLTLRTLTSNGGRKTVIKCRNY